ncbi:uncharacterized protein BT62DRAFT_277894 [Guyanagaster necrorhizus]|uniref:Uncharacterized protein n=1 Tax=Guyanagaster necrorhizus TaxID=856835 RepID=A0A9P7W2B6_9AGAR|nr:uncharacterized protein BT62DRAFT_277894 [Guyanagaster necrorhizus MCA 3950]KAG7452041.1 hypothetical protein BT62DRAFT_277894 [Guyanagaster necrorhizus MCA 3950]
MHLRKNEYFEARGGGSVIHSFALRSESSGNSLLTVNGRGELGAASSLTSKAGLKAGSSPSNGDSCNLSPSGRGSFNFCANHNVSEKRNLTTAGILFSDGVKEDRDNMDIDSTSDVPQDKISPTMMRFKELSISKEVNETHTDATPTSEISQKLVGGPANPSTGKENSTGLDSQNRAQFNGGQHLLPDHNIDDTSGYGSLDSNRIGSGSTGVGDLGARMNVSPPVQNNNDDKNSARDIKLKDSLGNQGSQRNGGIDQSGLDPHTSPSDSSSDVPGHNAGSSGNARGIVDSIIYPLVEDLPNVNTLGISANGIASEVAAGIDLRNTGNDGHDSGHESESPGGYSSDGEKTHPRHGSYDRNNSQNGSASGRGGNSNEGGGGQDGPPHNSSASSPLVTPATIPQPTISQTRPAIASASTVSGDGFSANTSSSSQLTTSILTSPESSTSIKTLPGSVNGTSAIEGPSPPLLTFISTDAKTYTSTISGSPTTSLSIFTTTGTTTMQTRTV